MNVIHQIRKGHGHFIQRLYFTSHINVPKLRKGAEFPRFGIEKLCVILPDDVVIAFILRVWFSSQVGNLFTLNQMQSSCVNKKLIRIPIIDGNREIV